MATAAEISLDPDFTKRPVGYLEDWQPYRSTQILLGRIQGVLDEYEAHLPLTVRQIYYRLVASGNYKKGKQFEAKLSDALVNARRAQIIPFSSIRDDGIMGGGSGTTASSSSGRDCGSRRRTTAVTCRSASRPGYRCGARRRG